MGLVGLCLTACSVSPTFVDRLYAPQDDQSTQVFNTPSLDNQVLGVLTGDYDLDAVEVDCPGDEQTVVGNTFTCAVTMDDESTEQVQVTVTSADGQFQVAQPH